MHVSTRDKILVNLMIVYVRKNFFCGLISTHIGSHPLNCRRISSGASLRFHVAGSVGSTCERTMLKERPPDMV
jgi:hypothetical protein